MSYKVVFCGTPAFAVPAFKVLLASDLFEVALVLTQPDRPAGRGKRLQASPVKLLAQEQGIPVITPESCKKMAVIQQVKALAADVAIVVAYGQILPQKFLDSFKHGCVNIHGSLLPRWRGAAPIQRSLMAGDRETGVSLQVMVLAMDAGPIIGERRVPLDRETGTVQLFDKLARLGAEMLPVELVEYLEGNRQPVPQDERQATYAKKIEKGEAPIDWQRSAEEIHNKVRGLNAGGPFATATFRNRQVNFHQTAVTSGQGIPGTVIAVAKECFTIACGEQALQVLALQPESKARMSAGDFVRGFQLKEGENFSGSL